MGPNGGGQRFKVLGRKGKEKRKSLGGPVVGDTNDEDDEDWTMEGIDSGTNRHGHDVLVQPPSPSRGEDSNINNTNDTAPPLPGPATTLFDSQLTEVPAEKKKGKGRGLVKKTSRLFSRDRDKDKEGLVTAGNSSSLAVGKAERQLSYSSANSTESAVTTSSTSSRPPSSSRNGTAKAGHLRRLSQDSQFSWHAGQGSVRSGVSSIREMSGENKGNNTATLSASVPTLNRNALPQPGPSGTRPVGQDTIPSRMSSWITNFLPTNTATSGEASSQPDSQASSSSPARKGPSAAASFLYAARQKAVDGMRHLLDSEAQPDKSPDTIWVMGVGHSGYRPSTPVESPLSLTGELPGSEYMVQQRRGSNSSGRASPPVKGEPGNLRPAVWPKKKETSQASSPPPKAFGNIFSTSTLSLALPNATTSSPGKEAERLAQVDSPSKGKRKEKEVIKWPEQCKLSVPCFLEEADQAVYDDFRSRVWCTYRSQYAPIVSLPDRLLVPTPEAYYSAFSSPADAINNLPRPKAASTSLPNRPSSSPWAWTRSGEERGLTSDAGWGCMLRTGQSMLANALIHLHLGRGEHQLSCSLLSFTQLTYPDWRVPVVRPEGATDQEELDDYATYVRLLSWFLDDPSPLCPFSVHRMALIGKELGKDVGEWFGPSTAAGALK